jgi:hypothetical protein
MFILGINLVSYVLKVSISSFMFILGFNLVISVIFVTCGKQFAYMDKDMDTWTLGHVSDWNDGTIKTDGKWPTYANGKNIRDQIETFKTYRDQVET